HKEVPVLQIRVQRAFTLDEVEQRFAVVVLEVLLEADQDALEQAPVRGPALLVEVEDTDDRVCVLGVEVGELRERELLVVLREVLDLEVRREPVELEEPDERASPLERSAGVRTRRARPR